MIHQMTPAHHLKALVCLLIIWPLSIPLFSQDCYMLTNANNGEGDTGLNGYYELAGIQYGCQKFVQVGDLNGNPLPQNYRVAREANFFWAVTRNEDNVMRYMKVTSGCSIPTSGYTPCCGQGGDPLLLLVATDGCAQFILPVELVKFVANTTSGKVILEWQTASETVNEGFEIQRRAESGAWQTLAFIPGRGTTTQTTNYRWTDENPPAGTIYYRLRQRDFDGTFEYSKVISIEVNTDQAQLKLWPNPAKDQLEILLPEADYWNLELLSVTGQSLGLFRFQDRRFNLALEGMKPGVYFVIAENGTHQQYFQRFVIK